MKLLAFASVISFLVSGFALAAPAVEGGAGAAGLNSAIQAQNERISRLEAQLQSQGLLNLLNQIESLKEDIARLRGTQEEQAYRLDVADKRTKDLFGDLDERVKELASRPVASSPDAIRLQPSQTLLASPISPVVSTSPSEVESEAKAYEVAHALIRSGKYVEAIVAFQSFLEKYPSGRLAANALYWIGISQVTGQSDFKGAAETYQRLLKDYPASAKVPDALLSLARAQIQQGDKDSARATLDQLFVKYPASKAAENGKKLLATLM